MRDGQATHTRIQCAAMSASGVRCDLDEGHRGPHGAGNRRDPDVTPSLVWDHPGGARNHPDPRPGPSFSTSPGDEAQESPMHTTQDRMAEIVDDLVAEVFGMSWGDTPEARWVREKARSLARRAYVDGVTEGMAQIEEAGNG